MDVVIDEARRTIRPAEPDGDTFFGLGLGANGTAATCRRQIVERPGYTWERHNGAIAIGLQYVPSARSEVVWRSPWGGRA